MTASTAASPSQAHALLQEYGHHPADYMTQLRHALHRTPELSGQETVTAALIAQELEKAGATKVLVGLGDGTGVVGIFDSGTPGPTVLLRCELDALPITEEEFHFGSNFNKNSSGGGGAGHCSQNRGISHKCGHDGHMAVLGGVAQVLGGGGSQQQSSANKKLSLSRGRVALLFQPAEETGQGAPAICADERFQQQVKPDYVFGFHNLPRREMHSIWVRNGTFASASEGFRIVLQGASSHSSYPEHGKSPAAAVARLLQELPLLPGKVKAAKEAEQQGKEKDSDASLLMLTLTQAVLGEKGPKMDFGVAPGVAEICGTVRAYEQDELDGLKAALVELAERVVKDDEDGKLTLAEMSWHEGFPATVSQDESVTLLRKATQAAGLALEELEEPMRWSEDFAHFLNHYPGAFFGVGSGADQPQLHNEHYDFPDELLPTGVTIYLSIIDAILGFK